MKCRVLKCILFSLLSLLAADWSLAQHNDTQTRAADSLEAAEIAKKQQPGKVLSVKKDDGYYKVKILHEGKVNYIVVKAR